MMFIIYFYKCKPTFSYSCKKAEDCRHCKVTASCWCCCCTSVWSGYYRYSTPVSYQF